MFEVASFALGYNVQVELLGLQDIPFNNRNASMKIGVLMRDMSSSVVIFLGTWYVALCNLI